jgi:pimeloyl-ACP methyl ester carboxylesterase
VRSSARVLRRSCPCTTGAPAVELDDDARRQLLGAYCGHLIPLEQPERLTNEIASFIERET